MSDQDQPDTSAARLHACENEGCDGTMNVTKRVCFGFDTYVERMCDKCRRTVRSGFPPRVTFKGYPQ